MTIDVHDYHHSPELHALADRVMADLGLDGRWMVELRFLDEGTVEATWLVHEPGTVWPVRVYYDGCRCSAGVIRARRRYSLGKA